MVHKTVTPVHSSVKRSPKDVHPWRSGEPAFSSLWITHSGILAQSDTVLHAHHPSRIIAPHQVVSGRGRLITDHQDILLSTGDMFCLLPGISFSYQGLDTAPWRLRWVILNGLGAQAWAAASGFTLRSVVLQPDDPIAANTQWETIHTLCGSRVPGDDLRVISALYALAAALVPGQGPRLRFQDCKRDLLTEADRALAVMGLATTATDLAKALGVSASTLLRACREQGHRGPSDFLTSRRLTRSEELLRRTDLKMAAIAAASGFASEKYFLHRFKTWRGQTPSAFRKGLRV